MSIDFNTIPSDVRVPFTYIEFDNTQANGELPTETYTILVIGQRLPTGQIAAGVPTPIQSGAQAAQYFGAGSMIATMLDWVTYLNQDTPVVAIALDDNEAGAQATGKIEVTGTATAAGTLSLYIGGVNVPVGVNVGDTAEMVASNIVAAIAEVADTAVNVRGLLPVTSVVDEVTNTTVDLTSAHKGVAQNDIDVRVNYYTGELTPAGLQITVVPMSGGTQNPDVSVAIAAMGDVWYQTIAYAYNDAANAAVFEAELTSRFGGVRQIDGVAYNAYRGNATATDTYGTGRNSPLFSTMGTSLALDPPYVWAAVNAAVVAPSLSEDPARPLKTLVLTGLKAPAQPDQFTWDERNLHLHSGISTYTVDSGGNVLIERQITNYQKNASDITDTSYLQVETIATLSYLRYSTRFTITNKYPRCKLADDSVTVAPGQPIVTPSIMSAELVSLASDWVSQGLIQDLADFKTALTCQINSSDPTRLDVLASPNLVKQFFIFAEQIQFS